MSYSISTIIDLGWYYNTNLFPQLQDWVMGYCCTLMLKYSICKNYSKIVAQKMWSYIFFIYIKRNGVLITKPFHSQTPEKTLKHGVEYQIVLVYDTSKETIFSTVFYKQAGTLKEFRFHLLSFLHR